MPKQGDWVLIHVGFAMSKISEEDALDQMRILRCSARAKLRCRKFEGYGLENAENAKAS